MSASPQQASPSSRSDDFMHSSPSKSAAVRRAAKRRPQLPLDSHSIARQPKNTLASIPRPVDDNTAKAFIHKWNLRRETIRTIPLNGLEDMLPKKRRSSSMNANKTPRSQPTADSMPKDESTRKRRRQSTTHRPTPKRSRGKRMRFSIAPGDGSDDEPAEDDSGSDSTFEPPGTARKSKRRKRITASEAASPGPAATQQPRPQTKGAPNAAVLGSSPPSQTRPASGTGRASRDNASVATRDSDGSDEETPRASPSKDTVEQRMWESMVHPKEAEGANSLDDDSNDEREDIDYSDDGYDGVAPPDDDYQSSEEHGGIFDDSFTGETTRIRNEGFSPVIPSAFLRGKVVHKVSASPLDASSRGLKLGVGTLQRRDLAAKQPLVPPAATVDTVLSGPSKEPSDPHPLRSVPPRRIPRPQHQKVSSNVDTMSLTRIAGKDAHEQFENRQPVSAQELPLDSVPDRLPGLGPSLASSHGDIGDPIPPPPSPPHSPLLGQGHDIQPEPEQAPVTRPAKSDEIDEAQVTEHREKEAPRRRLFSYGRRRDRANGQLPNEAKGSEPNNGGPNDGVASDIWLLQADDEPHQHTLGAKPRGRPTVQIPKHTTVINHPSNISHGRTSQPIQRQPSTASPAPSNTRQSSGPGISVSKSQNGQAETAIGSEASDSTEATGWWVESPPPRSRSPPTRIDQKEQPKTLEELMALGGSPAKTPNPSESADVDAPGAMRGSPAKTPDPSEPVDHVAPALPLLKPFNRPRAEYSPVKKSPLKQQVTFSSSLHSASNNGSPKAVISISSSSEHDDESTSDDDKAMSADDEAMSDDEKVVSDDEKAMSGDEVISDNDEAVSNDEKAMSDDEAMSDDKVMSDNEEAMSDDDEAMFRDKDVISGTPYPTQRSGLRALDEQSSDIEASPAASDDEHVRDEPNMGPMQTKRDDVRGERVNLFGRQVDDYRRQPPVPTKPVTIPFERLTNQPFETSSRLRGGRFGEARIKDGPMLEQPPAEAPFQPRARHEEQRRTTTGVKDAPVDEPRNAPVQKSFTPQDPPRKHARFKDDEVNLPRPSNNPPAQESRRSGMTAPNPQRERAPLFRQQSVVGEGRSALPPYRKPAPRGTENAYVPTAELAHTGAKQSDESFFKKVKHAMSGIFLGAPAARVQSEGPSVPLHPLAQRYQHLPRTAPFTQTHWDVLKGIYLQYKQDVSAFRPDAPLHQQLLAQKLQWLPNEDERKPASDCVGVVVRNWGHTVEMTAQLLLCCTIFMQLLTLADADEYRRVTGKTIVRGKFKQSDRDGDPITLREVIARMVGIVIIEQVSRDNANHIPTGEKDDFKVEVKYPWLGGWWSEDGRYLSD